MYTSADVKNCNGNATRERLSSGVRYVFKYTIIVYFILHLTIVFTPLFIDLFQQTVGIIKTLCPSIFRTTASRHTEHRVCLSAVEGRRLTWTEWQEGRKESSHIGKVCQETQLYVLGASPLTDTRSHTHTHTLLHALPVVRDGYVCVLCRLVAGRRMT